MKYRNRLLIIACLLILAGKASAQMVGTDCFLQGQFIEAGINQMGGFGTCTSPVTYHSHGSSYSMTPAWAPGMNMDIAYDWGHDGWAVGTPEFMGAYTQPGFPQEGWSLQVGATEYRNGGWGGFCTGAFAIPGSNTGYVNSGGNKTGIWDGSVAGVAVHQTTNIDTFASWVVVTTVLRNTTGSAIPGIWYERTCDPDNASFWGGGSTTFNVILHQDEDSRHMVMVSTNSVSGIFDATNSYMAYATKDCRARCGIISGLAPTTTPQQLWTNTPTVTSPVTLGTLHSTNTADEGMFLVYNIGTIPANDSTIISYAVVFDEDNGIDSALPDPKIVINGVPHISWAPNTPNYDSFNVCLYPGMTTLPVSILYADDKDWSWSHWTWSPSLGLSATTGTSAIINTTVLPASITYTITGTDSASGMTSCNNKTFYLTIFTCNGATSTAPCVGDTMYFNAPGDSTDATYVWFGPAPSTAVFSTTQTGYRFPVSMADTGTYTVIKSVLGVPVDTATTYGVVHPLPMLSPSSSQVNCGPIVSTLDLFAHQDTALTFAWTGPNGFTATDSTPHVYGFDSSMQGIYYVHAVTMYGCKADASVSVWAGPNPDFSFVRFPGCPYDSVAFTDNSSNADTYHWDFGDATSDYTRNPPLHIYTGGHHLYTVTLTASNAHCPGSPLPHTVDLSHLLTPAYSVTDTICIGTDATFTDLSSATLYGAVAPLKAHIWIFGDGTRDTTTDLTTTHPYPTDDGNQYHTWIISTDSIGCQDSIDHNVFVLNPHMHMVSDTTFCLLSPFVITNTEWIVPTGIADYNGFTYSWTPSTGLSSSTDHEPLFSGVGDFVYTLTATINNATYSCPVSGVVTFHSILPKQLYNVTAGTTITLGSSIYLNADSELIYTWTPDDGSLNNPNINNPIATPSVTTTYTVYGMDYYGCRDTATVTIVVDTTQQEDIPTGFSPNGDGLNDVFRPAGLRFQKLVEMRVFNRWGECIFATNDKDKGWDGTYKGVPQDMGTYSYTIIVAKPGYGDNVVYKGTVTLIR